MFVGGDGKLRKLDPVAMKLESGTSAKGERFQVTPNLALKTAMLRCKPLEEKCKAALKGFVDHTSGTTRMMVAAVRIRERPLVSPHIYQNPVTNVGPLLR